MRYFLLPLALFALTISPSAEAAGPFGLLCRAGSWLMGKGFDGKPPIELTPEELVGVREWTALHSLEQGTTDLVLERPDQLLLLTELPRELRAKLFAGGEKAVRARIDYLGLPTRGGTMLDNLVSRIRWAGMGAQPQDGYAAMEAEIAAMPPITADAREKRLGHIRALVAVDGAKARLLENQTTQYQLRFDGKRVVMPDGKSYDYTRTLIGKLKIFIPYRDLIQHQSYENGAIVANYASSFTNGWAGLDGGHLAPDGRYIMVDAYHRAKAYALQYAPKGGSYEDTPVPMLVSPAADGRFFTSSHFQVMSNAYLMPKKQNQRWQSDKTWSFLPDAQRERLIELSKTDPAAAIRELYYESTGLTKLE